jgi:hypothetical protein
VNSDDDEEKPWVAYLKSLKTPMVCPLHRKVQIMVSSIEEVIKPVEKGRKKEHASSRVVSRKTVNKNPNCNHNSSSIFYNHSFGNIKLDDKKGSADNPNSDLLWANCEKYNEREEIKSVKDLILRLFHEPFFGEKKNSASYVKPKEAPMKDLQSLYSEFDKYFGHEEILIDGYKINKYSLWLIKKLNPHHKALMFALIELSKISSRSLAKDVLNELINMNNKWNKD